MIIREAMDHRRRGRRAAAEFAARRAFQQQPFNADACHLLGMILLERSEVAEAAELMRRSVAFAPETPLFRVNLAGALGLLGRFEEALGQLTEALVSGGGAMPELHNQFGATLEALRRHPEAVAAFQNAVRLGPDFAQAHHNLGNALVKVGRIGQALGAYREALRLRPRYCKAAFKFAIALSELGSADEAIAYYRHAADLRPQRPALRSTMLYTMHYSHRHGAEALYREHREWGRRFCDPLRVNVAPHAGDRCADRKLRVGYVSPDLRQHTVTKFIMPAFEHHDREHFEVFCYSDAKRPDHVTERCKGFVEHWHDTRGLPDPELAALMRQDHIDILVDLRGHAADNRLLLFCRKPAPVQVTMVGYFNTTGLSDHYRITDEHMDPPGQTEHLHTETLVRLPHSCWCYTPEPEAPQVQELPAPKNGFVTFGSLNKFVKVAEPCARLWARVMQAVPNSRLLLSVPGIDTTERVRKRLSEFGIPADRLDILGKAPTRREFLERHHRIDIALDTFPFNGITTTCEGLWMGVPCVSISGETSVARAGRSILHAANLPELATETPERFVKTAVALASDLPRLAELRRTMRDRLLASPLMDHRRFARDLEHAYRQMWQGWCVGSRGIS